VQRSDAVLEAGFLQRVVRVQELRQLHLPAERRVSEERKERERRGSAHLLQVALVLVLVAEGEQTPQLGRHVLDGAHVRVRVWPRVHAGVVQLLELLLALAGVHAVPEFSGLAEIRLEVLVPGTAHDLVVQHATIHHRHLLLAHGADDHGEALLGGQVIGETGEHEVAQHDQLRVEVLQINNS
jgi:hypothetical protein